MKTIPLSRGMTALVDDKDCHSLVARKWSVNSRGRAIANHKNQDGKWTMVSMHRFILNPDSNQHVDHINRNPLGNRRENLRIASPSQNMANQGIRRSSKTGVKGVYFCGSRRQFVAQIRAGGTMKHLGRFETKDAAAAAYDAFATAYFGEFACTNSELRSIKSV